MERDGEGRRKGGGVKADKGRRKGKKKIMQNETSLWSLVFPNCGLVLCLLWNNSDDDNIYAGETKL